MTETDGPIQIAKERPASTDRMDRVDMALSATGVTLALFAAFFPWYVFFNHDLFTQTRGNLVQHMQRDLPILSPRTVFSVSPSASININKRPPGGGTPAPQGLDDITTATLPEEGQAARAGRDAGELDQPLPGRGGTFKLLHVAGGRALIEDTGGMYMVGVGDVLPDDSKLVSLDQRDGRWVLTTSKGDVFSIN